MKRVVITGATGAVGTALVQQLIDHNIEVLVLCRKDSKRNCRIPEHPLIQKQYSSLDQLGSLQNDTPQGYDVFYHLAWSGTVGAERNDMYLQNRNVKYSLDAVEAAVRLGCKAFIGAGSQAEYGRAEGVLTPSTPVKPETGYGMAKLCAGQMTRQMCDKYGIRHIWARILSVYGPCDGDHSMIMSTIRKLFRHERAELTPGEQMWDYLYSADAAQALFLLGQKGIGGKVYCVGSGIALPLRQYIEILRDAVAEELAEPTSSFELGLGDVPYSRKQVMHLCADISELREDTGFEPSKAFEDGIATTVAWCRKHL